MRKRLLKHVFFFFNNMSRFIDHAACWHPLSLSSPFGAALAREKHSTKDGSFIGHSEERKIKRKKDDNENRRRGYRGGEEPSHYFKCRPSFSHFLVSALRILVHSLPLSPLLSSIRGRARRFLVK